MRRRDLVRLVADLEAEDAFTRLEAEKRLRDLLQGDFGYRWDAPPEERSQAVVRLRAHFQEERKKEKAENPARGAGGKAGLTALDLQQLKGMSPQQVEEHLQKLLGKAGLLAGFSVGRPRCQECGQRPATVEIVEVRGTTARSVTRLCDPCATRRGEVR